MNKISEYISDKYGILADYPWAKYHEFGVFRRKKSKKWFGLFMQIDAGHTDFRQNYSGEIRLLNLKCDPSLAYILVDNDKISRAYHMNKRLWISLNLNSKITNSQIFDLIDESFEASK